MALLPSYYLVQIAFAPLPPPFSTALAEIEVDATVDGAAAFRLHFDLSRTFMGDFDAMVVDIFRPLAPIRISVSAGLGVPQTLINGFVRDAQLSVSNQPGRSALEVSGMDALGTTMGLVQMPAIWPSLPDSEVARAIFARYAVAPTFVFPTPPTRTVVDTTTTQHSKDNAYLRQLAQRNAYEVFIQPDPLIGLDQGHFHPPFTAAPPQGVLSIDFGSQTNLNSLSVGYQMLQPTGVIGVTIEPKSRAVVPVFGVVGSEPPMGLEPALFRILPPLVETVEVKDATNPAEAIFGAVARATESSRAIRASGEVDGLKYSRPLLPGLPVLIRGAGRSHSGLYYVTSVSHHISKGGYTQRFQAVRNAVGLTGAEVFVDPLAAVS
ncbi:MAG: phage late control D family protein [Phenylobacterium sp.]